jgi:hypothetical protein
LQFGHSKDDPERPQFKVAAAALDPLGMPGHGGRPATRRTTRVSRSSGWCNNLWGQAVAPTSATARWQPWPRLQRKAATSPVSTGASPPQPARRAVWHGRHADAAPGGGLALVAPDVCG